MAKAKGESNQGIIVALVFFILSTITLGVTTYLGYSGQDGFEQKIKDATTKEAANGGDRDYWKAVALLERAALGKLQLKDPKQLDAVRKQLKSGSLDAKAYDKEDPAEVKGIIDELDTKLVYNDAKFAYDKSYPGLIAEAKTREDNLLKANGVLEGKLAGVESEKKKLESQLDEQAKAIEALTTKLNKENNDTKTAQDKNRAALEAKVKELTEQNGAILNAAAEEKKSMQTALKKASDQIVGLKNDTQAVNAQLQAIRAKSTEASARAIRTDWKIASITGGSMYVNLGSADNVRPQLTFNVHGTTPDGRPIPEPKGTVEIVNVIDTKLSKVRVTSVRDPNRNPILQDDIISNPSWDPFQKRRIAFAGYMDLYGDGRENTVELRRILERQNVQVDAFLDLKDFSTQGAISLQTEILVLGDNTESLPVAIRERDNFGKKLSKGIEEMQAEAKKNGVAVMGMRKYLESIGYRLPRPNDR